MNQQERRIYLIREMQREMPQYADIPIPEEEMQQRRLLRSLFNLRPPYPASEDFLNVQDAYLSEVIRENGATPEQRRSLGDRLASDAAVAQVIRAANVYRERLGYGPLESEVEA